MLTPLEPWIERRIGRRPIPRALARYQREHLLAAVTWARCHSPFYREHLAGLPPSGLEDPARWTDIPFTTAADLIGCGERFLCGSLDAVDRVVTLHSSGTTAAPKRIFFTREDLAATMDFFAVGMSGIVSPGDRVLILLPGDLPDSVGDLLKRGLAEIGCEGVVYGPVNDPDAALHVIAEMEIDALVGIPVQVLSLVRGQTGELFGGRRVKKVLLTTDHVPRAVASAIEAAWPCQVFNHYGMSEMGLGGGVECAARSGYHLREADLYFEIVDPATGAGLKDGDIGEIVFTTLHRRMMPLIRYRTGDLGRFMTESCPCGSVLRRLAGVNTRVKGLIALGHYGRLTMADLDEAVFPIPWVINFQAEITGNTDAAVLHISCRVNADAPADADEMLRTALRRISAVAGALKAGRLKIAVTCESAADNPVSTGVVKRVLQDSRQG